MTVNEKIEKAKVTVSRKKKHKKGEGKDMGGIEQRETIIIPAEKSHKKKRYDEKRELNRYIGTSFDDWQWEDDND